MVDPETVGFSGERPARIRPVLEKHIGPDNLPGAVTLLARRGEIVHQKAVGIMDRQNKVAMRPNAIIPIYSMTKSITAVAMMTLCEKGACQLADPVSSYIPKFSGLKVYAA